MTEQTNRGRATEEAREAKPCRLQLEHLKSLAAEADKVPFVQHLPARFSHMLPGRGFQHHVCPHIHTFYSEGKVLLTFTEEARNAAAFLSAMCNFDSQAI